MGLTTPAIIVIVIVACLAAVSLGAALTRQLNPAESYESRFQPSHAQEMYMRSVRMRTLGTFRRESLFSAASRGMGRDLESRCRFVPFSGSSDADHSRYGGGDELEGLNRTAMVWVDCAFALRDR